MSSLSRVASVAKVRAAAVAAAAGARSTPLTAAAAAGWAATRTNVVANRAHMQLTIQRGLASASQKEIASLLAAASSGNIHRLEELLANTPNLTVHDGDYDKRTPLHLAAGEGRVEMVKYLIAQGVDINAEDRWGNTALDDALSGKQDEIIRVLRGHKACLGHARMSDIGALLCQAANEGNVQQLQRLIDCGVDINSGDYDHRTALHVAASEGNLSTIEFLLTNGAQPNVADKYGNTPLSDASRSRSRSKRSAMALLKQHGAQLESDNYEMKHDPLLQGSLLRSLPFIALRTGAAHIEAWLPNDDESEFILFESSTYTPKEYQTQLLPFTSAPGEPAYANNEHNTLGRAWKSGEVVPFTDIVEKDIPKRYKEAKEAGLKSGLVVPVMHKDKPVALIKIFLTEPFKMNEAEQNYLRQFASGIVSAGVFKKGRLPVFSSYDNLVPAGQIPEVYASIKGEEVFNSNLVYHEVEWFYSLGLQKYYFERFSTKEIANHIHAFIAAKKVAATTGRAEEIQLSIESENKDGGASWLYMCPIEHARQMEVEKRIQAQILKLPASKPYTLEFFMSERTIMPSGKKQMGLYVLETSDFANPTKVGKAQESNIREVASVTFLRTKTDLIKDRYQSLLTASVAKISPVAKVYPTYRDGTTPVMFAFYQGAGTTTSYMLQLTELLKHNGLVANRKFIETFANGIIVFSLYIQPREGHLEKVDTLLKQFSMLHLVPESTLTSRFLNGDYTAEQYTYFSTVSRFIYYFLNKRSEEFDVLAKSLKNDPMNLGRLRLLQTRLKREAVSQERILACIQNHSGVVVELFKDFDVQFGRGELTSGVGDEFVPTIREDLVARIKNEATTVLDQQILIALATFNAHLLRTNFYSNSKSALSFRVDPRYLMDSDWPVVPYGVFFVMGSDFQGFHIRFKDVSRGGVRMIRSGDRQAYNSNLETLFAENYGLAYTQNKKNKAIPEGGSKGTILLNLTNQNSQFLAFQKYVSGLLDIIIPQSNNGMVDRYGKEELIFLGPDEGTADFMQWAALYAGKRGYRYWRGFTTGKPPSLGGIPHDMFGMTTRSVHRYVLGCLSKMGLKEENVTKFQTGGPDGDLGSNEILISKDKTKAIVDGSGVLYDPVGIDREELTRLAKKRVMIKEFDSAKLSPGGFKVLITDANVTLPDGTHVESGLAFRNEFHLHPLSSADMFVPCGGRPESVNLNNVNKLFDAKGVPRFKIIVEGANLFFTQDARMVLEQAGVTLYKDASTNKGGVTSSSLEVLAALAFPSAEFEKHMCVKDPANKPDFYQRYVAEIQDHVATDADLEFECIWREHERTKTPRYLLTDQVSDKINTLNDFIQQSSLWKHEGLRKVVLMQAIPKSLTEQLGLDTIFSHVPDSYLQAIFGAYLASRYVYKHGLDANEFAFFEFMQPFLAEIGANTLNITSQPQAQQQAPAQKATKSKRS